MTEEELERRIELACYNHRVVQQRLIDFIYRLGAMDPAVADEVRRQFKEWNLPTEAVNK